MSTSLKIWLVILVAAYTGIAGLTCYWSLLDGEIWIAGFIAATYLVTSYSIVSVVGLSEKLSRMEEETQCRNYQRSSSRR